MNDAVNDEDDLDAEVAAAFEPIGATEVPELWDRVEIGATVTELTAARGWREPRVLLGAAAVLAVLVGGLAALGINRSQEVDVANLETSTTTTTTLPTTTAPVTTTPAPPPPVDVFENATWVRFDFEAGQLVSNLDQTLPVDGVAFGGRVVDRLPDGTVIAATADGVLALSPGSTEAVELTSEPTSEFRRTAEGDVVAITGSGASNLTTGGSLTVDETALAAADVRDRIDARNGFSVEVIPGEYEVDDLGFVERVIRPDALRLMLDGEQSTIWGFGGPAEFAVELDDFDGRYILAHRRPDEPALPPAQHVVIDLRAGSTESFIAIPGTVSLATVDEVDRPSSYQTGGLDLCPTMRPVVGLIAPSDLGSLATAAFDRAALGITRCDETWLRTVLIGSSWDDNTWNQAVSSLQSVPGREADGWIFGEASSSPVWIGDNGDVEVRSNEGAFDLRIIKFEETLVLAGTVGPESAAGLRSAARSLVGTDGLVDFELSEDGSELDFVLRQAVEEMIGTGFGRSPTVEAFVTPTLVRVISQDSFVADGELTRPLLDQAGVVVQETLLPVELTDTERSTVEALQAFAAGGTLAPSIEWADQIVVGAGSNESRLLTRGEVGTRSNWLIENFPYFRGGGEEAFSALRVVSNPVMVGGPHNHCASAPRPGPASLAGMRRVSIQPDTGTIDSCLQWNTFDVFFDEGGRVAGVTVDWWEP